MTTSNLALEVLSCPVTVVTVASLRIQVSAIFKVLAGAVTVAAVAPGRATLKVTGLGCVLFMPRAEAESQSLAGGSFKLRRRRLTTVPGSGPTATGRGPRRHLPLRTQ